MRVSLLLALLLAHASGLDLQVDIRWQGRPITVPSDELVTPSGETFTLSRLDFLLNQPQLTFDSGEPLSLPQWHHFLHGEQLQPLHIPVPPEQSIRKILLHLGPSNDLNHGDPNQHPPEHPLNPLHNRLHHGRERGYTFFALEGHLPEDDLGFSYHYRKSENRLALTFEGDFDPEGHYQLSFHLDRIFPVPFRIADRTSTQSRTGDPVLPHFRKKIARAFTLEKIATQPEQSKKPKKETVQEIGTPYRLPSPRHFPRTALPADYPLTRERIRLGRELFSETALSKNTASSCASCHPAQNAFVDNTAKSFGFLGEQTKRHSMPVLNLAWKNSPFFWDGRSPTLREQILKPIEDPLEMGEELPNVIAKLEKISYYPRLFEQAFGDREITAERLAIAIEQFMLALVSSESKFDRVQRGQAEFTEQEKLGLDLFMSESDPERGLRGADCFLCHSGALFTDHRFHNNGLPPRNDDLGREQATGLTGDRFKFSTPSLRNIALTAPYMHDGRFDTLEEVVDFYSTGIHRSPTLDPKMGKHPGNGLKLDEAEQAALVSFLQTLSDPRLKN